MISTTTSVASYTATASQTVFAYGFRIQNQSDLLVFSRGTDSLRSNITASVVSVSGVDSEGGGNVTLPAQTVGTIIFLVRSSTFTQLWDASNLNFFDPATVERVVDKLTILVQEVKSGVDASIRFEPGEQVAAIPKVTRAGKVLAFDEDGDPSFITPDGVLYTPGDSLAADSIASLKAISVSGLTNNQAVSVLGYYAAGDGGGGTFYYDSASATADNGGTVIQPTTGAGRWKRATSEFIQAAQFGVRFDGVACDAQLQALFDWAFGSLTTIVFGAGTVRLDTGVSVNNNNGQGPSVIGSPLGTIFKYYGSGDCVRIYAGSGVASFHEWRGISFLSNTAGVGVGLRLQNVCSYDFIQCSFTNFSVGTLLESTESGGFVEWIILSRCSFLNNTVGYELRVTGAGDSSKHGCSLDKTVFNIAGTQTAIKVGAGNYWYNFRLDTQVWASTTVGQTCYLIDNAGNSEGGWGFITNERFGTGDFKIKNTSSFVFNGPVLGFGLTGYDGITPTSTLAFRSYNTSQDDVSVTALSGITAISVSNIDSKNSRSAEFRNFTGANLEGIGFSCYNNSPNDGFYFGSVGFGQTFKDFSPFLHIGSAGLSPITAGNANGNVICDPTKTPLLFAATNRLTPNKAFGRSSTQTVTGNTTNLTSSYVGGNIVAQQGAFLVYLYIVGTNFELRQVYICSHEGYGGVGSAVLLATLRSVDSSATLAFTSLTVDAGGNLVLNMVITGGDSVSVTTNLIPIGN